MIVSYQHSARMSSSSGAATTAAAHRAGRPRVVFARSAAAAMNAPSSCGPRISSSVTPAAARPRVVVVARASTSAEQQQMPAPRPPLPDGRLPFWQVFQQYVSPRKYQEAALRGRAYAITQFGTFNNTLVLGDPQSARALLTSEPKTGLGIGWGPALQTLIGPRALSMTTDAEDHAAQRALVQPLFAPDAVAAKLPGIEATVCGTVC
jgi:hypothetical protein